MNKDYIFYDLNDLYVVARIEFERGEIILKPELRKEKGSDEVWKFILT